MSEIDHIVHQIIFKRNIDTMHPMSISFNINVKFSHVYIHVIEIIVFEDKIKSFEDFRT